MMASSRTSATSSGRISGSGFASAKMMGESAIDATISWETMPFTDSPTNTSAPSMASASVVRSVSAANRALYSFTSVRSLLMTPLLSTIRMFSRRTPRFT